MSHRAINLQDAFLNQVRKESIPVVVTLTTGMELRGEVKGFDSFTIIVATGGVENLVYKHAVACIAPTRSLSHTHPPRTPVAADGRN